MTDDVTILTNFFKIHSCSTVSELLGVQNELKDAKDNTISYSLVNSRCCGYSSPLYIDNILGLYGYSSFRYPNITDRERKIVLHSISIGAIDAASLAKISKIIIQAVAVENYGGKLPIYNRKSGVFE